MPPIDFLDIRILEFLDEQPFHSVYSIDDALGVSNSTILSHLRESLGMKNFHLGWIPTGYWPVCDRFGWKLAESYCSFSRLIRKINVKDLRLGTSVGSLWNFIILRNGAYRQMMPIQSETTNRDPKIYVTRYLGEWMDSALSI